jgi:hypothetical protein
MEGGREDEKEGQDENGIEIAMVSRRDNDYFLLLTCRCKACMLSRV